MKLAVVDLESEKVICLLNSLLEDGKVISSITLLLYMLAREKDGVIKVIPKDVIRELNITMMTYSRWIRELIAKNIVEKIDSHTYRLIYESENFTANKKQANILKGFSSFFEKLKLKTWKLKTKI